MRRLRLRLESGVLCTRAHNQSRVGPRSRFAVVNNAICTCAAFQGNCAGHCLRRGNLDIDLDLGFDLDLDRLLQIIQLRATLYRKAKGFWLLSRGPGRGLERIVRKSLSRDYLVLNLYIIVFLYVCPGFSTVVGKAGLLGESG